MPELLDFTLTSWAQRNQRHTSTRTGLKTREEVGWREAVLASPRVGGLMEDSPGACYPQHQPWTLPGFPADWWWQMWLSRVGESSLLRSWVNGVRCWSLGALGRPSLCGQCHGAMLACSFWQEPVRCGNTWLCLHTNATWLKRRHLPIKGSTGRGWS